MSLRDVSVQGFEGPLDLLLELIEQEKLDITQVSLAQVTNQYLERIRALAALPPDELAQFLLVAARLILLKSKRILPQFPLTPEEEESIQSLEEQLREYQKFRARARVLRQWWMTHPRLFAREGYLDVAVGFYPPPGITAAWLKRCLDTVLTRLPTPREELTEVLTKVVSLEQRIREIEERVRASAVTSFQEAVVKGKGKPDVIVSFLALLELVKQQILAVEQSALFRDILIRKRHAS